MSLDPVIAVNRFGMGAAPGELAAVAGDPRGWLAAQAAQPAPSYPEFDRLNSSEEGLKVYARWIAKVRELRSGMQDSMQGAPRGIEDRFRTFFGPIILDEVGARLAVAAATPAPFHERLTWFWANHFTVSAEKPVVFALVGSFEREAIRPNVNGRFGDMLLACTRHPAMILYLDNQRSVRNGWVPRRRAPNARVEPPTGLNENLAREILELHTLGADAGYTQADVTEFARVLTGWTVGARPSPGFRFVPDRHEPGPRTLLGRTYAEEGAAQGEAVLRDLAAHPATARHVATKLARHFIADDPPAAAVARIERAFLDTGGHLPSVHGALLECPEAWAQPLAKLKTPIEYVTSCLRALPAARAAKPQALYYALRSMGQRPYFAPSPQGWPDSAAAWAGADAVWKRVEWAGILAARAGWGVDPARLAADSYGGAVSVRTSVAVARAESQTQGLALWLASPEFQRR
ncbi:MAG: DUF1800 domain-containing protein [Burkholderiales bacterium]